MNKSKHTKGPWHADPKTNETEMMINGPEGFLGVAKAYGDNFEETEANAQLIATAPELLKACERAIEALTNVPCVGDIYDEQHSGTHIRAVLQLQDVIKQAHKS